MAFVGRNNRDRSDGVAYSTTCIMDRKVTLTFKGETIMKQKKVKEFVNTHKKEIALTAVTVIGGALVYAITKKKPTPNSDAVKCVFNRVEDLTKPEMNLGTITELWKEGDYVNAIVNDFTVADLGRLGEELCKIDSVMPETTVTALMGFLTVIET